MLTSIKNCRKSNDTLHNVQGHQIHEKQKPLEKERAVTMEETRKQMTKMESQNKKN
jgi:hypothetical protein